MIALDLDQRLFAITGKVPQHDDGSFSVGISLNTSRVETLEGAFFDAQSSPYRAYLARTPRSYCPFGGIKDSTNGCSFHIHHRSPNYRPSSSFGRTYRGYLEEILPVKRNGRWEFKGHCFVTTDSITIKHGRHGSGVNLEM